MRQIGKLVKRIILGGAVLLFVVAVPFAIALSNFRWFALEPGNYLAVQQRHAVARANGLSPAELLALDRALVRYFQSDRYSFANALEAEGVVRSPYSERDLAHLQDVHDLVRLALDAQWLATGYVLFFAVVALVAGAWQLAIRCARLGGLLTIALVGVLGILAFLDWDALFLQFHFLSFSNDLWRLDPSRDALIRLYPPPGFYMDVTILLVAMSLAEAIALAVLAGLLLRRPEGRKWRTA